MNTRATRAVSGVLVPWMTAISIVLVIVLLPLPTGAQSPDAQGPGPVLLPFIQMAGAADVMAASAPSPMPIDSTPYGHSYSEWAAAWLQWVVNIAPDENPLLDTTGAQCARNQSGHVWFLVGSTNNNPVERNECVVSTGTALFFPIRNVWFFNDVGWTRDAFKAYVEERMARIDELAVTVDGVALEDLWRFRADTGFFSLNLPEGGYYDTGATACGPDHEGGPGFPCVGDFDTFLDGYWAMLRPLPPGEHTIEIYAHTTDGRVVDVTYNLTVSPGRK